MKVIVYPAMSTEYHLWPCHIGGRKAQQVLQAALEEEPCALPEALTLSARRPGGGDVEDVCLANVVCGPGFGGQLDPMQNVLVGNFVLDHPACVSDETFEGI